MANDEKSATSDYSATKAPENKEHVQSELQTSDDRLIPGGAHGARAPVGMSELDRDTVPNGAANPGQTDYGQPPLLELHRSDRE
jgi:hypothetical protein